MKSLCLEAKLDNLPLALDHVLSCARVIKAVKNRLKRIELIVEEVFVNICNYAYPDGDGNVEVACHFEDSAFVIQFTDWGIPFDITLVPEPDLTTNLTEKKIGGFGVYFVKQFAEDVHYNRQENKNIVKITIKTLSDTV